MDHPFRPIIVYLLGKLLILSLGLEAPKAATSLAFLLEKDTSI
jgi:hypothetical protein